MRDGGENRKINVKNGKAVTYRGGCPKTHLQILLHLGISFQVQCIDLSALFIQGLEGSQLGLGDGGGGWSW